MFRKLRKMLQILSCAAVVIGALRVQYLDSKYWSSASNLRSTEVPCLVIGFVYGKLTDINEQRFTCYFENKIFILDQYYWICIWKGSLKLVGYIPVQTHTYSRII